MSIPEGPSPIVAGRVPAVLVDAARQALGRPDATGSELVRAGLAKLAGLDVDQAAAPLPRYRPPRRAVA